MPVGVDQQQHLEKKVFCLVCEETGNTKPSLETTDQDFKALSHAFASLSKPAGKSAEV